MIPTPPPSCEQTINAVAACGIARSEIRIQYEDELQSDVVIVTNTGAVTEEKVRCLKRAIHPFYILEIQRPDQRSAFYSISDAEDRKLARAEALKWLQARGLLHRVPKYDPAQGIDTFARALEEACSLASGVVLEAFDQHHLTFRRDFIEKSFRAETGDRYSCLSHMISASNADEHEIRLVFIGNAAVGDEHGT